MKILFDYMKNDSNVFAKFKPTRAILRKMDISSIIQRGNDQEQDLALDFTSFLLRYNRLLDYSDFSDDVEI